MTSSRDSNSPCLSRLEKNLAALSTQNYFGQASEVLTGMGRELAGRVDALCPRSFLPTDPPSAEISLSWEPGRDFPPLTLNWAPGASPRVDLPGVVLGTKPLHSRRHPEREKVGPGKGNLVLLGTGLGYNLTDALKRPQSQKFIIIEPHGPLLALLLVFRDLTGPLSGEEGPRLRLLWEPASEEATGLVCRNLGSADYHFFPHRGCVQALGREAYEQARRQFWQKVEKRGVNQATLGKFEKVWTRNIVRNLARADPRPTALGDILGQIRRRVDQGEYTRAVIFCAGPSLYQSARQLAARLGENPAEKATCLFLCVDTARKIVHRAWPQLIPDFTFTVDPQPVNRHYLNGPPFASPGRLVADPTCDWYGLASQKKDEMVWSDGARFPLYTALTERELGRLAFGGSVSTNAFDFALSCGFRDIVFVGQDLAFTGFLAHSPGAVLEERIRSRLRRLSTFEKHNFRQLSALPAEREISPGGHPVLTNQKLKIFRDWLADKIRAQGSAPSHLRVYSLGKSGLTIPGVNHCEVENLPVAPANTTKPGSALRPGGEPSGQRDISETNISGHNIPGTRAGGKEVQVWQRSTESVLELIRDLGRFQKLTARGEKISRDIFEFVRSQPEKPGDARRFSEWLSTLEEIDQQVSAQKTMTQLVGATMQKAIFEVTEGWDINKAEEKENPHLAIARRSLNFYARLRNGTELLRGLLVQYLLTR